MCYKYCAPTELGGFGGALCATNIALLRSLGVSVGLYVLQILRSYGACDFCGAQCATNIALLRSLGVYGDIGLLQILHSYGVWGFTGISVCYKYCTPTELEMVCLGVECYKYYAPTELVISVGLYVLQILRSYGAWGFRWGSMCYKYCAPTELVISVRRYVLEMVRLGVRMLQILRSYGAWGFTGIYVCYKYCAPTELGGFGGALCATNIALLRSLKWFG
jgi:hypothetical protein